MAELEELRAQLHQVGIGRAHDPLKFEASRDEFVYTITIISNGGDNNAAEPIHTLARATLDTGCDDNWVSTQIINRAGLQGMVTEPNPEDMSPGEHLSFSGHPIDTQGCIELTWFMAMPDVSSQRTRTDKFHVFSQLPVDLVLGKAFVKREFILVAKHALGKVKQGVFTDGKQLTQRSTYPMMAKTIG